MTVVLRDDGPSVLLVAPALLDLGDALLRDLPLYPAQDRRLVRLALLHVAPAHERQLGELLLAEPVHRLYRSSALTTLASSILEDDDVFACGNYWVRPMTSGDPQGHYPLHQGASQPRPITRAHGG